MWQQRSRINRLGEGDQNTNFFHPRASARRRKNRISKLKDDTSTCFIDYDDIYKVA